MQCPRCGLVNSSSQSICQCGYLLSGPASSVKLPSQGGEGKVTEDEKNWAVGVHCCELAGMLFPMANLIGPIVILMVKRKESAFVASHAKTALNFQITFFLIAIIAVLSVFVGMLGLKQQQYYLWIPAVIFCTGVVVGGIASIVFSIVGLIRAREGKVYRYPLAIPFLGR